MPDCTRSNNWKSGNQELTGRTLQISAVQFYGEWSGLGCQFVYVGWKEVGRMHGDFFAKTKKCSRSEIKLPLYFNHGNNSCYPHTRYNKHKNYLKLVSDFCNKF